MNDTTDPLKEAMAAVDSALEGSVAQAFNPRPRVNDRANYSAPAVKAAPEPMTLPQRLERIEMRLDAIEIWVQRIAKTLGVGD